MPYLGDTNSQVDVWENFARVITPSGTPSPLLAWVPTQDEMMRAMMDVRHDQDSPTLCVGRSGHASHSSRREPRTLAGGRR